MRARSRALADWSLRQRHEPFVQRELPTLGFTLQLVSARPSGPLAARGAVAADTVHPDAGRFHLRGLEARSRRPIEILEWIDAHRLHGCSCYCVLLV